MFAVYIIMYTEKPMHLKGKNVEALHPLHAVEVHEPSTTLEAKYRAYGK